MMTTREQLDHHIDQAKAYSGVDHLDFNTVMAVRHLADALDLLARGKTPPNGSEPTSAQDWVHEAADRVCRYFGLCQSKVDAVADTIMESYRWAGKPASNG